MLEVKLHDIGEGMTEGEVIHYLVKVGDRVTIDQPLVEVQTDKMVAELPSPGIGTIADIVVDPGQTVQVGTTILYIDAESEVTSTVKEEQISPISQVQPAFERATINPLVTSSVNRVLATPYTRKIARDHDIDIEAIIPTDPSGRVTDEDVYRIINKEQPPENTLPKKNFYPFEMDETEELPFRGIRKQIARNMSKSLYTIPHVTHFDEVDMTNLFKLRNDLKENGTSITVSAFLLKALVFALKEFPIFNAELDEANDRIMLKKFYHIGIATDTDNGLLVPVLQHVDQKSLQAIHNELKWMTNQAKTGKLKPADMKNSTFTVSNVGPLGSTGATPIINYPETALIAFHKTKKMPIVNERDEIVIRHMMTFSMSFDHRVADGATAVAFTNRFINLIEHPGKLLLEMK